MRQSHTTVVERNVRWAGEFEVEPCEVGWAGEALYFIRALDAKRMPESAVARIQISPDGIHWTDVGQDLPLPARPEEMTFARVTHFGGWLRAVGLLPNGAELTVIVYLVLKE